MLAGVRRTQIYLDERQAQELARRAAARGTTKSELIREALDAYLGSGDQAAERLKRFHDAIDAAFGAAPDLPDGATYVRELREADVRRQEELEERWRA
jgi:predicted DNA-binding protein